MPLHLISSSISQVYFKKSAEIVSDKNEDLLKMTKKIVITNTLIMSVFLIFINTIGIYLINFFLKNSWENLNIYLLIKNILTTTINMLVGIVPLMGTSF